MNETPPVYPSNCLGRSSNENTNPAWKLMWQGGLVGLGGRGSPGRWNILMACWKSLAQVPTVAAFRWTTQHHVTQTLGKVQTMIWLSQQNPAAQGGLKNWRPTWATAWLISKLSWFACKKYLEMDPHPGAAPPSDLAKVTGIIPAPLIPLSTHSVWGC